MSNLKPCPFCGSNDVLFFRTSTYYQEIRTGSVQCRGCECEGPLDDEADAIELWNKRAVPDIQADIKEFMLAAKQTPPGSPIILDEKTAQLRFNLCWEEFCETMDGLGFTPNAYAHEDNSITIRWEKTHEPDLEKLSDGVADSLYVLVGTLIAAGIDIWPIWKEVQRSNMSKFIDGYERADGKWVKGPSYSPANIKKCLGDQGWSE